MGQKKKKTWWETGKFLKKTKCLAVWNKGSSLYPRERARKTRRRKMQNWWRKTLTLFVGGGQLLSRVRLCDPVDCTHQGSLSFTISQSLLKFMSIESVMLSNQLILCHPLLLLPSIFPNIRVFSNESSLHIRWLKYWCFSISPYYCTIISQK